MTVSLARAQAVDFTFPFASFVHAVLIRNDVKPLSPVTGTEMHGNSTWTVLYPFSASLWSLFVATLIGIMAYYFALEWIVMNSVEVVKKVMAAWNWLRNRFRILTTRPDAARPTASFGEGQAEPAEPKPGHSRQSERPEFKLDSSTAAEGKEDQTESIPVTKSRLIFCNPK